MGLSAYHRAALLPPDNPECRRFAPNGPGGKEFFVEEPEDLSVAASRVRAMTPETRQGHG